jgi:hypothetical protein
MFNKNFDKNIDALIRQNPLLASKIMKIKTNKKYEIFQGKDPIDINMYDYDAKVSVYEFPVKETEDMLMKFITKMYKFPILYFYGIGNGIFFKTLLESNEYLKRVVLMEPELELFYVAFHFNDFSKSISENRLLLYDANNIDFAIATEITKVQQFKAYFKLYELHMVTDYYVDNYSKNIIDVNLVFTKAITHSVTSHGNSTIDNLMGLEHHIENIPNIVDSIPMLKLKDQKNSNLAVIVSLGPSLTKQLELLKKNQHYMTIIVPEAVLQVCYENGIKPDMVLSLERTDFTADLMKKTSKEAMKDTNFLVVSLMHKKAIDEFKKGRLAVIQRPLMYCTFFKELFPWGYVGIGMSVSNMAVELAYILEYKNIVVIGQDLAYGRDGASHAEGNVFGAEQLSYQDNDIEVEAYGGKGKIRTSFSWNLFREYFEKFAKEAKDHSGLLLINATEGGARIQGALEMPFAEVIKKYADKSEKKIPIDFTKFEKPTNVLSILKKSQRRLNQITKYGKIIQDKYEETFTMASEMSDHMIELNKTDDADKIDFDRLQEISDKIDDVKSVFDKQLFHNMFFDIMQSDLISEELEIAKIVVKVPEDDEDKKSILIDWVMKHRYWLFMVAGNINAQLEIIKRSRVDLDNKIKELEKSN